MEPVCKSFLLERTVTVANINKKSLQEQVRVHQWMKIQVCGTCKRGSRAVRELMGVTVILKEKKKLTNFKN